MEDEVAVQQCLTCKVGNDNPEALTTINRWLAENKGYKWIVGEAKARWGTELNYRSLKHHYENGHLPERHRIAREAGEQAFAEEFSDIRYQNLGGLNLIVKPVSYTHLRAHET